MLDKLADVEKRYHELEAMLVDPALIANRKKFVRLARERSAMEEVIGRYREWRKLADEERDLSLLLEDADPEVRDMARAELPALRERKAGVEEALKALLVPRDPNDERDV